mmetsp:Transcript_46802/g.111432  ORF Transcript_46802/g.111432 Transcript_46802/m.111432 type:complete len:202 (-) Transcript_46802:34-639(-)
MAVKLTGHASVNHLQLHVSPPQSLHSALPVGALALHECFSVNPDAHHPQLEARHSVHVVCAWQPDPTVKQPSAILTCGMTTSPSLQFVTRIEGHPATKSAPISSVFCPCRRKSRQRWTSCPHTPTMFDEAVRFSRDAHATSNPRSEMSCSNKRDASPSNLTPSRKLGEHSFAVPIKSTSAHSGGMCRSRKAGGHGPVQLLH